ncbi:MAG: hypothetical protein AB7Q00_01235 [Phycisphaerales bacterium]|nr:MAG: hypothetical protein IPK69_05835 [Phycisphaerales bacterium]
MSATRRARTRNAIRKLRERTGIASVLSMMLLIMFGSLAAAMAIVSKGNIATAATNIRVIRAQGAAETGLEVAKARLSDAAGRFVVSNSKITSTFGTYLWTGNSGGIGTHVVMPSKIGPLDLGTPSGVAAALMQMHSVDQNTVPEAGVASVALTNAPSGTSATDYSLTNWVYTPGVAVESPVAGGAPPVCFQITYAPLANGTDIRVISTGYDFSYLRNGRPVKRTVSQDYRMIKRVNHAIMSPNRVMIGKNVNVEGSIGSTFTDVTFNDGDPMVIRSDFYGLNAVLDQKLDDFFAAVKANDVDGDSRLRVGHPVEGQAVSPSQSYTDGSGNPVNPFTDVTNDGFVDDFDIFIKHFDQNNDGKLTLSAALTAGTPASGFAAEFSVDDNLAILIDGGVPDRNANGVYGYTDTNANGLWDSADGNMNDWNAAEDTAGRNGNNDQVLGFRDGYIDYRDRYAKVRGGLAFRATQSAWETSQGAVEDRLRGAVIPSEGVAAQRYGVSTDELPDFDINTFDSSRTDLQSAADGQPFNDQVATQLGISSGQLATYVESQPDGSANPRFLRLDPDVAPLDGLPDNWATAYYEKMPYASPNHTDYYYRPVYENMTFRDVIIPAGTNALFKNCTFIGVTYVRSTTANTHVLWGEYGKMTMDSTSGRPKLASPRMVYGDDAGETSYPDMLPSSAKPPSQMILMAQPPMDKADIPDDEVALTMGYNNLPDPLIVSGKRITDTKALSNNLRFHDCRIIGSIVSDSPTNYTNSRNKIQFTGSTKFYQSNPDDPENPSINPESVDEDVIAESSLMLPHYSVDLGSFNSPASQDLQLQGVIIAGVIDVRGNATIDGALMLTFKPQLGQGPLQDATGAPIGNPAGFNSTIGYFGIDDGDEESYDPSMLPIVGGVPIVGYDTNGDGIADVGPDEVQPSGSTPVPFNGYGRIAIRFNPTMSMPDGVMLPMQFTTVTGSYREGTR